MLYSGMRLGCVKEIMKKLTVVLGVLSLGSVLVACGEKKKTLRLTILRQPKKIRLFQKKRLRKIQRQMNQLKIRRLMSVI